MVGDGLLAGAATAAAANKTVGGGTSGGDGVFGRDVVNLVGGGCAGGVGIRVGVTTDDVGIADDGRMDVEGVAEGLGVRDLE